MKMLLSEYTRLVLVLSAVVLIYSLKAPEIRLDSSKEVTLGSNVTIDCVAVGDPRPTVKLYRNGVFIEGQEAATFSPITPNLGAARYTFTAVQGSGGPYECRANNGVADSNGNTDISKVINIIIIGPTNPVTRMKTVKPVNNNNTGSGSNSLSALSLFIILLPVAIVAFFCQ